jgi:hypothetical protein
MADSNTTDSDVLREIPHECSIWFKKFKNITSRETDPWQWNKDWENCLRSLSSKEVCITMGEFFQQAENELQLSDQLQFLKDTVCKDQDILMELHDMAKKGDFSTAWILLEERERKRHLHKGMEALCLQTLINQDSRAFCPEITISSMLKRKGAAFVDFTNAYVDGIKNRGEGEWYSLPGEWWEKAMEDVPTLSSEKFAESMPALLVLHRNFAVGELVRVDIADILLDE